MLLLQNHFVAQGHGRVPLTELQMDLLCNSILPTMLDLKNTSWDQTVRVASLGCFQTVVEVCKIDEHDIVLASSVFSN